MANIHKKFTFSHEPIGAVWLCDTCEHVHMRYGDISLVLREETIDELLSMACDPQGCAGSCENCNCVHFHCGPATVHMTDRDFSEFTRAVYRLTKGELTNRFFTSSLERLPQN